MTRLHFGTDRLSDLVEYAESARSRVESTDGWRFADLTTTGEGEGMVIAGYNDEAAYRAVAEVEAAFFEGMQALLTATPHGHAGTVVLSLGQRSE